MSLQGGRNHGNQTGNCTVWTDEEVNLLRTEWRGGTSLKDIHISLRHRSPASIRWKASALKLSRPPRRAHLKDWAPEPPDSRFTPQWYREQEANFRKAMAEEFARRREEGSSPHPWGIPHKLNSVGTMR